MQDVTVIRVKFAIGVGCIMVSHKFAATVVTTIQRITQIVMKLNTPPTYLDTNASFSQ
jgi:hypothetical protein